MLQEMTFEWDGDYYTSTPVTPNGDTAVELIFDEEGARIYLQQSLSGYGWQTFESKFEADEYYCTNICGLVEGQLLRIRCDIEPTAAAFVEND